MKDRKSDVDLVLDGLASDSPPPERSLGAPRSRLGFGKVVVPPKKHETARAADRIPLAVKSSPEPTKVTGMLEPAPGETPKPPPIDTLKKWPPPLGSLPAPPPRSLSPPPSSTAFQVKGGDVDFRLSKGTWAKVRPYVLWGLVPLGAALLGYYQGLKAAGTRMRANEAHTAAVAGELAELRATHDTKLNSHARALARDGVVAADHEERLNQLKPRVELLEQRVTDLSKQKAIIVKPSGD